MRERRSAKRIWVLAGLLTLCLAAALPIFAAEETSAADEWAALTAAEGLDVRDSRNRSVSRPAVAQALGRAQRNQETAGASRRSLFLRAFLDRVSLLASTWREELPPFRRMDLPGLILDPPRVAFFLITLMAFALSASASRLGRGSAADCRSRQPAVIPLRR